MINIDTSARAVSGGSTYTGAIQTSENTIYYVNDGTTSATETTWVISGYTFIGNNGITIDSGSITFSKCESVSTGSVPSGSFSTTINATVTFDANGGKCNQTIGYSTSVSSAVTLPTPTYTGYIFKGWYTATSGGTRAGGAGESYTPSANITLYAQWSEPCTVTYNASGGSCDISSAEYTGSALTLPDATKDGYIFAGWYTAASDGTRVGGAGDSYAPEADIILYAQWNDVNTEVTVTFDANGGSCTTSSSTCVVSETITLPTPDSRTGYNFNGWYTAAEGGTKIGDAGASYTPSADITLYAQWEQIAYTITYSENEVSSCTGPKTAYYGDTVTVTVVYTNSQKSEPTVVGATSGSSVTVTSSGSSKNYTYTFTMPAENVTMTLTGDGCVTGDTLITLADGSQVRVDALTGDEELLVWNMETGSYDTAPMVFIDSDAEAEYTVVNLHFSDGAEVGVIYEHGFFDYDLGKYVYLDASNAENYIGHTFVTQGDISDNTWSTATLTDVVIEQKVTTAYSPVTFSHLCYFTDGVLSMPGGIEGLFNIFDVDTSIMAYDAEKMAQDIETYGLYTYDDFADLIPEEAYYAFNGAYLKVAIGKGLLTWEDIEYLAERYVPLM